MQHVKLHKYLYYISISCVITGLLINSHTILLYAAVANIITGVLKEYDSISKE